jgi:hypothetical protein
MRGIDSMLVERIATLLLGFYLLGTSALHLARGEWLYADYLGLSVPVPLAVAVGTMLLFLGLFRWRRITGAGGGRRNH